MPQPNYRNLTFKDGNTWYSGSPYLGYKGTLPTGTDSLERLRRVVLPVAQPRAERVRQLRRGLRRHGARCCGSTRPAAASPSRPRPRSPAGHAQERLGRPRSASTTRPTTRSTRRRRAPAPPTGTRSSAGSRPARRTSRSPTRGTTRSPRPRQNFNTLASTGRRQHPAGRLGAVRVGTGANTTYGINNGSSSTRQHLQLRLDRQHGPGVRHAPGAAPSRPTIGAAFTNTTGDRSPRSAISYTGEQWRLGAGQGADRLDFQYSTNATSLTNGTWTDVNGLDFNSPVTTGTVGAHERQRAAEPHGQSSSTITGLSIPNGATYRIRWTDFDRDRRRTTASRSTTSRSPRPGPPSRPRCRSGTGPARARWAPIAGPTAVGSHRRDGGQRRGSSAELHRHRRPTRASSGSGCSRPRADRHRELRDRRQPHEARLRRAMSSSEPKERLAMRAFAFKKTRALLAPPSWPGRPGRRPARPPSAAHVTINLCAVAGTVTMPDAVRDPDLGLRDPGRTPRDCVTATASLPGPVLDVNEGDMVTINVTNALPGGARRSDRDPGRHASTRAPSTAAPRSPSPRAPRAPTSTRAAATPAARRRWASTGPSSSARRHPTPARPTTRPRPRTTSRRSSSSARSTRASTPTRTRSTCTTTWPPTG